MTTMTMLEDIVAQIGVKQKSLHEAMERLTEVQAEAGRTLADLNKTVAHVTKNVDNVGKEVERVTKNVEHVNKSVGGLSNSIGEITEMLIIPGLKGKMREFKHAFTIASPRREYSKPDGSQLTEVDLLLENCVDVMVVEVKTQFSIKWLNKFLKKLELLRKNERTTGMSGKTMYAAIAGIGFEAEARELAVEKGMYIIEIEEDEERVNVIPPAAGKAGTW